MTGEAEASLFDVQNFRLLSSDSIRYYLDLPKIHYHSKLTKSQK